MIEKAGDNRLVRSIGMAGAAVLVVNCVIGAGIFAMPAAVVERAGLISPWLFLIVGILMITIVLTFAELASYFDRSGGPVLYTTTAFGPHVGFGAGWLTVISRVAAYAANSNIMAMYLGDLLPWFSEGVGRHTLIFFVCALLTGANYIGVRSGLRTMAVLTVFKLVPIVLLVVLGLRHVTGDTLFPGINLPLEDFGGTILLLIYPFVGFESAAVVSGETRSPRTTMPRAIVRTLIGIGILYFLIVLVYIAVLPDAGERGATLIDVGRALLGPAGVVAVTLAAVFSIGGNLSSIMLVGPRLTFALAREGSLPAWFGRIHERYSTPGNSILALGALGLVLALSGSFVFLAIASSLTRLLVYALCIASLPVVRKQASPESKRSAYRIRGGYTVPAMAMILSVWAAMQSDWRAWAMTVGLLAVGFALYAAAVRGRITAS